MYKRDMAEITYKLEMKQNFSTGLIMVTAPEVKGFIVHAYSIQEMIEKLPQEFKSYVAAAFGRKVDNVEVIREATPPGFFPPSLSAKTFEAIAR